MKNLADFTQIMLDMPGILGYISCLVLVVLSVQILRSAGAVLSILYITMRWVKSQLIRPSAKNLLLLSVVSIPVFLLRQQLSDGVQWFEQAYINPVYLQSDTSTHALAIYETELSRHVDPYDRQAAHQGDCRQSWIYAAGHLRGRLFGVRTKSVLYQKGWHCRWLDSVHHIRAYGAWRNTFPGKGCVLPARHENDHGPDRSLLGRQVKRKAHAQISRYLYMRVRTRPSRAP